MKPIKKIALLHDMCGIGKAALTNMIPILSVMGVEVCPLPTMLLSTHTGGYGKPAINKIDPQYIEACAQHYRANQVHFDMIFIGYLGDIQMIDAVQYFISCFPDTLVVFDPIMGDHGMYYSNFNDVYGDGIRRLLSLADIILPNLTECCLLTDSKYQIKWTKSTLKKLCLDLQHLGAKDIIITSVPLVQSQKGIVICYNNQLTFMENEQIPSEYHGTGDAFDGVFVGNLLKGNGIIDSVSRAHEFVCACINESNKYHYSEREGLIIEKTLSMIV